MGLCGSPKSLTRPAVNALTRAYLPIYQFVIYIRIYLSDECLPVFLGIFPKFRNFHELFSGNF